MPNFILTKNKNEYGFNEIHILNCEKNLQESYFLGWYFTPIEAIKYSEKLGFSIVACLCCCKKNHEKLKLKYNPILY